MGCRGSREKGSPRDRSASGTLHIDNVMQERGVASTPKSPVGPLATITVRDGAYIDYGGNDSSDEDSDDDVIVDVYGVELGVSLLGAIPGDSPGGYSPELPDLPLALNDADTPRGSPGGGQRRS